ncbi:MAG: nucleotidyltransferase domain-containing protein [Sedimentisphaerales bacterium]|nr:nucleotidyltransferase domain-containing protein [Sedimentisphaerales bacterium]
MLDIVENNLSEIRKLCLQFHVRKLELFGSALDDKFDRKLSDIDFLVEFQQLQAGQYANSYFGLLEAMKTVLGRDVDMVMTKAIKNPYFLQKINQNRKVLYAA